VDGTRPKFSAQVSGTRKIWYQNAWHTSKVSGTRNLGGELGSCAMGLSVHCFTCDRRV